MSSALLVGSNRVWKSSQRAARAGEEVNSLMKELHWRKEIGELNKIGKQNSVSHRFHCFFIDMFDSWWKINNLQCYIFRSATKIIDCILIVNFSPTLLRWPLVWKTIISGGSIGPGLLFFYFFRLDAKTTLTLKPSSGWIWIGTSTSLNFLWWVCCSRTWCSRPFSSCCCHVLASHNSFFGWWKVICSILVIWI